MTPSIWTRLFFLYAESRFGRGAIESGCRTLSGLELEAGHFKLEGRRVDYVRAGPKYSRRGRGRNGSSGLGRSDREPGQLERVRGSRNRRENLEQWSCTRACEELSYVRLQADNFLMLARFSFDLMDLTNAPTVAASWLANGSENGGGALPRLGWRQAGSRSRLSLGAGAGR